MKLAAALSRGDWETMVEYFNSTKLRVCAISCARRFLRLLWVGFGLSTQLHNMINRARKISLTGGWVLPSSLSTGCFSYGKAHPRGYARGARLFNPSATLIKRAVSFQQTSRGVSHWRNSSCKLGCSYKRQRHALRAHASLRDRCRCACNDELIFQKA